MSRWHIHEATAPPDPDPAADSPRLRPCRRVSYVGAREVRPDERGARRSGGTGAALRWEEETC